MNFGTFIRHKRTEAKLSQNQVAVWLGFAHRSNVHRKEMGRLEWKLWEVEKLAELFNQRTSELIKEYESVCNQAVL